MNIFTSVLAILMDSHFISPLQTQCGYLLDTSKCRKIHFSNKFKRKISFENYKKVFKRLGVFKRHPLSGWVRNRAEIHKIVEKVSQFGMCIL